MDIGGQVADRVDRTAMDEYLLRKEGKFLGQFTNNYGVKRCLDIFCGCGRISRIMDTCTEEIIGLDMNVASIKKYLCLPGDKFSAILGDGGSLPFKVSSFDCITCIQGPEYSYPDINDFLAECKRLLIDEGYLIFSIANNTSYKRLIYRAVNSKGSAFYRNSYKYTIRCLREHGFKVLKCSGYNWPPFNRDSDNPLIGIFERLEDTLQFEERLTYSPWVLFIVQKERPPEHERRDAN